MGANYLGSEEKLEQRRPLSPRLAEQLQCERFVRSDGMWRIRLLIGCSTVIEIVNDH